VAGSCENGNEPSGRKFIDRLSNYQFLKKQPVPLGQLVGQHHL
jgi:hypothetical protein